MLAADWVCAPDLPIVVQEIDLAAWLIVKRFNAPAIASRSSNNGNERALERGMA